MTKVLMGDVCAFIRGVDGGKNTYVKVGVAFQDGDRVSIKLDAVPINKAWEGWLNIFPRTGERTEGKRAFNSTGFDDDIPF